MGGAEIARNLRQRQTLTEKLLWDALRNRQRGYKVRRQHSIDRFVVDFYISDALLIIEVDGSIHADQEGQDRERQTALEHRGLRILRFPTSQVEQSLPAVLHQIDTTVFSPNCLLPLST